MGTRPPLASRHYCAWNGGVKQENRAGDQRHGGSHEAHFLSTKCTKGHEAGGFLHESTKWRKHENGEVSVFFCGLSFVDGRVHHILKKIVIPTPFAADQGGVSCFSRFRDTPPASCPFVNFVDNIPMVHQGNRLSKYKAQ